MAHHAKKDGIKNILFSESTCIVKAEQFEEDFTDDTVHVSHSNNVIDNVDLKDDIGLINKIRQCKGAPISDTKTELSSSEFQNDDIKIEEETIGGNIKIEYTNGQLYCETCHAHYVDYCIMCGMLHHILNKHVQSPADNKEREQLPSDILKIQKSFGRLGIFALKVIPERVKFGPFIGISASECPLKIKGGKFVINKDKSKYLNWMQYVNFARNTSEQNLLVLQHENNIYYESTRQILEGDELLVYFGETYEGRLNNNFETDFMPTVKHIITDVFACTFCCLGFSSKAYLAKHKTVCLASAAEEFLIKELMQCPSCKIHLDREEYFQYHVAYCCERSSPTIPNDQLAQINGRKTRGRQIYKCKQCKYRTKYKGDLKSHTNQHHEVKTYKCAICNRRFKTGESLKLHEENAHVYVAVKEDPEHSNGDDTKARTKTKRPLPKDDAKQFKCPVCEFRTKYESCLKRHVKTKHLREYTYKCDTCGHRTRDKSLLRMHIKSMHLNEFDYDCDTCGLKTNNKTYFDNHVKAKHLKESGYSCDTCAYKTNHKTNFDNHIKTKHPKQCNYTCDMCDYSVSIKSSLESHVKAKHPKEFDYKCQLCQYVANKKNHLEKHVKAKHLCEFDYKCDRCSYKTNCKRNFQDHTKSKHFNEFDYKCDVCSYKTNRKLGLKYHIKAKHLKEYDYKCEMCDYKANVNSNLERHIKTKHLKEFDYNCALCKYKTNNKTNLDGHVKRKHLK